MNGFGTLWFCKCHHWVTFKWISFSFSQKRVCIDILVRLKRLTRNCLFSCEADELNSHCPMYLWRNTEIHKCKNWCRVNKNLNYIHSAQGTSACGPLGARHQLHVERRVTKGLLISPATGLGLVLNTELLLLMFSYSSVLLQGGKISCHKK